MPTAYTQILFDEPSTDFATFAQRCAREFGACIWMRDASLGAPLTEPVVEPFYLSEVESAGQRVEELCSMSQGEVQQRFADEVAAVLERNEQYAQVVKARQETIDAMLAKVAGWRPPSEAHEGLKRFMRDQLSMSRPTEYIAPLPSGSALEWWGREILSACDNLRRAVKSWQDAKEKARVNSLWIQDLKKSIGVTK